MNKYKKLISNTLIFVIGSFSSKVLVFLLMPLYTRVLTPGDYGTIELVTGTANLLIPIITLSVTEGVIRFGLERKLYRRSDVYTTGVLTVLVGAAVFLCLLWILNFFDALRDFKWHIFIYVLSSGMKGVHAQFIRAKGMVKLYALDGIFTTILTIVFTVVFLLPLQMGINGYIFAIILADIVSTICLFLIASLRKFIDIKGLNLQVSKMMLRYSIPLIPTAVSWWVINMSDRYIVTYFLGSSVNGLYTIAYKVPTIITVFAGFFYQAWQMSAVEENGSQDKGRFYSSVFRYYRLIVFLVASGLLMTIKISTRLLVSDDFYTSYHYAPFLIAAVVFTCLVQFTGTIYVATKKTVMSMVTTCIGAVANIVLNFLLIPVMGATGAAVATFISFALVFIVRAIDTRRYIRFRIGAGKLFMNTLLLVLQGLAVLFDAKPFHLVQLGFFVLFILLNLKDLVYIVDRLSSRFLKKRRTHR